MKIASQNLGECTHLGHGKEKGYQSIRKRGTRDNRGKAHEVTEFQTCIFQLDLRSRSNFAKILRIEGYWITYVISTIQRHLSEDYVSGCWSLARLPPHCIYLVVSHSIALIMPVIHHLVPRSFKHLSWAIL